MTQFPWHTLTLALACVALGFALGLFAEDYHESAPKTPITLVRKQSNRPSLHFSNSTDANNDYNSSNNTASPAQPNYDKNKITEDEVFPKPWQNEIQLSLEPFREKKISRALLDETCSYLRSINELTLVFRVLIYNNQVYVHNACGRTDMSTGSIHEQLQSILQLLCLFKLPNMELAMSWEDQPLVCKEGCPLVPLFSWSRSAKHYDLVMPYCRSIVYLPWREDLERDMANIPILTNETWNQKKPLAIWRGSTTGGYYGKDNWRTMPRVKLVEKCNARGDLCDAKLMDCHAQCDPAVGIIMTNEGILNRESSIPQEDMGAHWKYTMLVDGNGAPSQRAATVFSRQSLVIWQETQWQEFFYSSLRPYVHYLPTGLLFEDLYDRILWAKANDDLAQEIVKTANRFSRQYLNRESWLLYFKTLLEEYSTLLDFEPTITDEYKNGRVWLHKATEQQFRDQAMGRWKDSGEPRCKHWNNIKPGDPEPVYLV